MSKIIGVTVGTQLPKPNFKQTDPTKGDYIKNKPDFDGLKTEVDDIKTLVGDIPVSTQIDTAIASNQANWEQNDETAADYIKGRTHWVSDPVETVVLQETTVDITEDGGYGTISNSLYFELSKTYFVTFDGVKYECVAWGENGDMICIGNGSIYGGEGLGGDEPFSCDSYDSGSCYVNVAEAGIHTISISCIQSEVHKLPVKYLPDGYPYVSNPVETMLLEETTIEITDEIVETDESVQISDSLIFEVGTTYIVTFNGVRYECVAWAADSDVFVVGGNDEPFECASYSSGNCWVSVDEAGTYTISIVGLISKTYTMDEKYLPNGATIGVAGTGDDAEVFNGGDPENASGSNSHAEGFLTKARGNSSHSEGYQTIASGRGSHAEGYLDYSVKDSYGNFVFTTASGEGSHAEGISTTASGEGSHSEGFGTKAVGKNSHAEGRYTTASGEYSHAEGMRTTASGVGSHVEGGYSTASNTYSHAEGYGTTASNWASHAEGSSTIASGEQSHAEGNYTIASSENQHVQGKWNVEDVDSKYAHIVGNGAGGATSIRSNAHTLDWNGVGWFAGGLKVGGTGQDDEAAQEVATKADLALVKNYIPIIDQVNGYTYFIQMHNGTLITCLPVSSIEITTIPTKTSYMAGEYFNPTGMVVIATYQDGTTKELTDYVYPTSYLAEGITSVEISYIEAGITYAASIPVTVTAFDAATILVDFKYTDNGDGTYTITGWKGTYNGEASTEMIIPNYGCIIV